MTGRWPVGGHAPRRAILERTGQRALVLLLGVLAVVLGGQGSAAAEPPFAVNELLTDRAGVLGTEADQVQQALEAVRTETGGALHVVLVDSFEGTTGDWTEQAASRSQIGSSYLLLAISVQDHTYSWWLGGGSPWDATEVEELISTAAEPGILAGDWSGATTMVAEGLRTGEVPAAAADEAHGDEDVRSSSATTTAVVGGLALVLLAAYQLFRSVTAGEDEPAGTERQPLTNA